MPRNSISFLFQPSNASMMRSNATFALLLLIVYLCVHCVTAEQRIVTEEELSTKTGNDGGDIWLSIMGEVYDVTSGRSFYGQGGSYAIFAGRDGSIPFITGKFTPEEAQKKLTEELSAAQLVSLDGWRKFYADNDKYPFVGLLQGNLWYDENGNPTEELKTVREMIANFEPPAKKKKDTSTEL